MTGALLMRVPKQVKYKKFVYLNTIAKKKANTNTKDASYITHESTKKVLLKKVYSITITYTDTNTKYDCGTLLLYQNSTNKG